MSPITYKKTGVELTLPIAHALLAFASDDDCRPHLGIGIDDQRHIAATNGYAGLRFEGGIVEHKPRAGAVWSHEHVKTACKVARARKEKTIELRYADRMKAQTFPPFTRVLPEYGLEQVTEPVGFNPIYIGALAAVTKALEVPAAALVAMRAPLDPLSFIVDDHHGLRARAVIMPCRL